MIIHRYRGIEPRVGKKIEVRCGKGIAFIGVVRSVADDDQRRCEPCFSLPEVEQPPGAEETIYVIEQTKLVLRLTRRGWFQEIGALDVSETAKKHLRAAVNALLNGAQPPALSGDEFFELDSAIAHIVIGGRKYHLAKPMYFMRLERPERELPVMDVRPRRRRKRKRPAPARGKGGHLDGSAEGPPAPS